MSLVHPRSVRVLDRTANPTVSDDHGLLPADASVLSALGRQVGGADLLVPPVALPAAGVAVATSSTVWPHLLGTSVSCGTSLMAVPTEVPGDRALDRFMRAVRERFPYPTRGRMELTRNEVVRAVDEGARFSLERYDAPAGDLEAMEDHGRVDLDRYGGLDALLDELPGLALQLARFRFGTVGPAGHYVEVQRVEEVLDPVRAAELGVVEGGVTIQVHAGGGVLAEEVGRLFVGRKADPVRRTVLDGALKGWFQLRSASPARLRQRLSLYFTDRAAGVPLDSAEGRRLMLAYAAAANYGAASRAATYASLRRLAADAFGCGPGRLIVDSAHRSVHEGTVAGAPAVVHRLGAAPAHPGRPVLLPGTHRTSSYLAVAGPRAHEALHSVGHGAGPVVEDHVARGLSGPDPAYRSTLRYRYFTDEPAEAGHYDDRGVDAVLAETVRAGLAVPVARMRPVAVLH